MVRMFEDGVCLEKRMSYSASPGNDVSTVGFSFTLMNVSVACDHEDPTSVLHRLLTREVTKRHSHTTSHVPK